MPPLTTQNTFKKKKRQRLSSPPPTSYEPLDSVSNIKRRQLDGKLSILTSKLPT